MTELKGFSLKFRLTLRAKQSLGLFLTCSFKHSIHFILNIIFVTMSQAESRSINVAAVVVVA